MSDKQKLQLNRRFDECEMKIYELRKSLQDERNSRYPIFKLFPNSSPDPVFDMWWYKLPLWKKIKYKIRLWLSLS